VKTLPAAAGQVGYTYDELTGCDNAVSRLVKVEDPSQVKVMSYDRLGRVKKETRSIKAADSANTEYITEFTFDLLSRKKTIHYPEDPGTHKKISVTYTYGFMGVEGLSTGGDVPSTIVSAVDYNEFGQMDRILRGNGTETSYAYDIRGRLTNLRTVNTNNGAELQNVTYDFRIDNSVKAREDYTTSRYVRYEYTYDGLNRLVDAAGKYGADSATISKEFRRGYGYAHNGNLTRKDIMNPADGAVTDRWIYHHSNHAATGIDTTAFGNNRFSMNYDDAGNMIYQHDAFKGNKKEMTYDHQNRIAQVTDPDSGILVGSYWYDDQGFRVRKLGLRRDESTSMDYHQEVLYPSMYFGHEVKRTLEGALVPDSSTAVNNIYINGLRVAAVAPEGKTYFYLTDQVDSVNLIVDENADTVSRFEYLPYGETWVEEGEDKHNPKYNSQELDKETGYYYYNARHYDPEIARFVTADNVIDGEGDSQGWNRYSYVKGNPVVYKDPTGHMGDGYSCGFGGLLDRIFGPKNNTGSSGGGSSDKKHPSLKQTPEQLKKFAKEHYQKKDDTLSDKLQKHLHKLPINSKDKRNKRVIANDIASSSCYSLSLYNNLKGIGANVESSYEKFFERHTKEMKDWPPKSKQSRIRVEDAYVRAADLIVKKYRVNGEKLRYHYTNKWSDYINNKSQIGIVKVKGHFRNFYQHNGERYVTDTGYKLSGKKASQVITKKDFQNSQGRVGWITIVGDKKK